MKIWPLLLTAFCLPAWAELQSRPAEFRLGFETVTLPGDEAMGLVGGGYLLETLPGFYVGPAAYGALTGHRGGFYTGGMEGAWRRALWQKLEFEAGYYAGGGGGGAAPQGGGLMLRPHADLLWRFGVQRAGVSWSQVRFPNGRISSRQVGLVWSVDDEFWHTSASQIGSAGVFDRRGGVGMDRIGVTTGFYQPRNGVVDTSGAATSQKIGAVGFRMEQYLNPRWLWGIEAAGAVHGGADGFAEVLGSLAWETPVISDWLYLGTRGAIGMGGGGKVNAGGGLFAKAGVYGLVRLGRDHYVSLDGGVAVSPDGQFRSNYGLLQLGMTLDHPAFPQGIASRGMVAGWQWSASMQHYRAAQRYGRAPQSLEAIGFKLERQLAHGFYLSGQAHSALRGDAGGYSVGLVGLGWQTPKTAWGASAGIEALAGAAGGGGVATQGGAITQPMAYIAQDIGDSWQMRVGGGRVQSRKGALDTTVLDVSLGFRFGLPER